MTEWIAKQIVTVALVLLRRQVARELRKRGVVSFRLPPMMPLMEDSVNVGIVWQDQRIMHLHLPHLGDVLVVTKGSLASIAVHQMLTAHDWVADMNGLRKRFYPEQAQKKGVSL